MHYNIYLFRLQVRGTTTTTHTVHGTFLKINKQNPENKGAFFLSHSLTPELVSCADNGS